MVLWSLKAALGAQSAALDTRRARRIEQTYLLEFSQPEEPEAQARRRQDGRKLTDLIDKPITRSPNFFVCLCSSACTRTPHFPHHDVAHARRGIGYDVAFKDLLAHSVHSSLPSLPGGRPSIVASSAAAPPHRVVSGPSSHSIPPTRWLPSPFINNTWERMPTYADSVGGTRRSGFEGSLETAAYPMTFVSGRDMDRRNIGYHLPMGVWGFFQARPKMTEPRHVARLHEVTSTGPQNQYNCTNTDTSCAGCPRLFLLSLRPCNPRKRIETLHTSDRR